MWNVSQLITTSETIRRSSPISLCHPLSLPVLAKYYYAACNGHRICLSVDLEFRRY